MGTDGESNKRFPYAPILETNQKCAIALSKYNVINVLLGFRANSTICVSMCLCVFYWPSVKFRCRQNGQKVGDIAVAICGNWLLCETQTIFVIWQIFFVVVTTWLWMEIFSEMLEWPNWSRNVGGKCVSVYIRL